MNINVASQNNGILAFSAAAAASPPIDVRHHVNFGFTFHVIADIAVEAVFEVEAAPPSAADPCVPGPFVNVAEVLTCMASWGAVPATESTVHIPVGTKAGSICTGTLPCKPDAFVHVIAKSGDTAKVIVVAVLGGPK